MISVRHLKSSLIVLSALYARLVAAAVDGGRHRVRMRHAQHEVRIASYDQKIQICIFKRNIEPDKPL